jgi:putative transcriptional regulator
VSGSDLSPALLVAMPQLLDPNFHRTVVLLIDHDEGGTFGLVLNRGTDLPVAQLCASLGIDWQGREERSVEWGGPVQPEHGWLLMGEDAPGHLEVTDVIQGVRFSRSPDVLRECAESPPRKFRVFLGYAGWGPGQLQQELVQGAWLVAPASAEFVFDTPRDALWEQVVRHLGVDPATLVPTQGVN